MITSPKILIIGNASMVGSRLLELWPTNWQFSGAGIENREGQKLSFFKKLDITCEKEVQKTIAESGSEIVLNCSAITDVEGCQKEFGNEEDLVFRVNAKGVENLALACKILGRKLIHFSTDFIFDGKKGPYDENAKPATRKEEISWYGWTKLKGEEAILNSGCNYLIARIAYPYRSNFAGKTDFVRNIINRLEQNKLYPMFEDQFLTPTFIDNIAMALQCVIENELSGIYNIVDDTTLSAYDAALTIAQAFCFDYNQIGKSRLEDYIRENPQTAPRPKMGGLSSHKINQELAKFGKAMTPFQESLEIFKSQIKE